MAKKKADEKINSKKISIEDRISIKEMQDKIDGMLKDKEAKCKAAKAQLIDMLDVTADKYRTVTGTAEALRILRFAYGKDIDDIEMAGGLAYEMAIETIKMKGKAEALPYEKMDQLCDGFYAKEFTYSASYPYDLAHEMMRVDLCRNVGGAAEDMVEFIKRVDQEIEDTRKALAELESKKED